MSSPSSPTVTGGGGLRTLTAGPDHASLLLNAVRPLLYPLFPAYPLLLLPVYPLDPLDPLWPLGAACPLGPPFAPPLNTALAPFFGGFGGRTRCAGVNPDDPEVPPAVPVPLPLLELALVLALTRLAALTTLAGRTGSGRDASSSVTHASYTGFRSFWGAAAALLAFAVGADHGRAGVARGVPCERSAPGYGDGRARRSLLS